MLFINATMRGWIERRAVFTYFVLAYVLSWSIAVPLALQAQGLIETSIPMRMHYLTAFGPAASGIIVAAILQQRLKGRTAPLRRRSNWIWWLIGFASPLLLFMIGQLAAIAAGQPAPAWTSLGQINFLPDLGIAAWLLWFATSGVGEEVGWRGFLLPRLQETHTAMTSSVLLAIGWAGWHLPALFYLPSYAAIGLVVLPGFFLGILAGSIVLTWLYNRSGGSVLAAVLWHASFNFVTASPNASGLVAAVTSTFVIVWAIAVIWRCEWLSFGPRFVSPGTRST